VTAPQKRQFIVLAKERGISERQACRLASLSRTVARYRARPKRHAQDNETLVERLKEIARKKRRRGYRLAYQQLRQEGWPVNHIRDAKGVGARASAVESDGIVGACPQKPEAAASRGDSTGGRSPPSQ